jgi:hypothetical protein
MLDALRRRFMASQPWTVVVEETALEQALAAVRRAYAEGPARQRAFERLDRFLADLARQPLKVLGHPPLGTDDPEVFRYGADRQALISVVADLDLKGKRLIVVRIVIKGASHARD